MCFSFKGQELKMNQKQQIQSHNLAMRYIRNASYSKAPCASQEKLRVVRCKKLLHIFPSAYLPLLMNLEIVSIHSCSSLVEVIQLDVPKLPCSEDGVCVFRNLTKLIIYNGDNVRYLLSPSITSEILSIQELGIEQGQLIEELIRDVEDEEKTDNLVLPQLMKLVLGKLENLRWFFHGDLGFSSLVDFTFYDSPRMKVACCGTLCTAKTFEVKIWFGDGTSMIQLDPDIEGSQIAMKNEAEFSTTLVEDVEFVEMDNTPCTWSPTGLPLMIHFLMEAPSPGISSHPLSRIE